MKTINQTKGVGFKNFRRFENFPMLEFGKITYMVGRNNSGKSTMVKALLLVMDYLQNQTSSTFSFDNKVLEDANIVTFGRAKNNSSATPIIEFNFKLHQYDIHIRISGEDDNTVVNVNFLSIEDKKAGYNFSIDYDSELMSIEKKNVISNEIKDFKGQKSKLIKQLVDLKSSYEKEENKFSKIALLISDQINTTERLYKKFGVLDSNDTENINSNYSLTYPITYQEIRDFDEELDEFENNDSTLNEPEEQYNNLDENPEHEESKNEDENKISRTEYNEFKELISLLIYHNNIQYKKWNEVRNDDPINEFVEDFMDEDNDEGSGVFELYNDKEDLKRWIDDFVEVLIKESFSYLGANPSKQSALFPLRAKDNALAQAIHQFKQSGIIKGDQEWEFVKKWMAKFEVGDDFDIKFYAGEAYEFHVIKIDSKSNIPIRTWNHLADKGMGSLQAMLLILRIASLIRKNKKENKKITLLVEEPELNLHPALQSLLTEFFHEVNLNYGFNFIVETHSEYVIRKAQLMSLQDDYISNQELNPNPFKIVYFHKEEGPYEMKLTEQGRFERDFGPGFYDIAANITMEIIKQGRKKTL